MHNLLRKIMRVKIVFWVGALIVGFSFYQIVSNSPANNADDYAALNDKHRGFIKGNNHDQVRHVADVENAAAEQLTERKSQRAAKPGLTNGELGDYSHKSAHKKLAPETAALGNSHSEAVNDRKSLLEQRLVALESQNRFPDVRFLDYRKRKRILVTGGAGFVGSHLVDRLMMMGHEVIVLDNFFTGRKRNVLRWIGHPNFELRNQDVTEELRVEVDEIYHLASPASPPHYMENPIKTLKTNTVGTINMLGLAKRNHARFLLASTSEVYGDPEVHPQKETYWGHVNPIGPRACYDEGKRAAEALTYAYARYENVQVRVARIFNTFGPRMHMNDGRVVSNFIIAALQNEPIQVYGNGKNTRSFQYVSDLVSGLIALMQSNYSLPVNLGNPEEHTIDEFADIIKQLTGSDVPIKHVKAAPDDPQRRKPDISLALKELGWKPVVPMREGLNRTIVYFRKELELGQQTDDGTPTDLS